jgi:predicted small lipoprotein YifL
VRRYLFRTVVASGALSAVLLLAGCGIKPETLEPPADANPAEVRDPNARKPPPPQGEKPDKPFILDGLLM